MWLSEKELFWALLYSTHTPTIVGNKNIFRLSFLINNCRRAPKRSSLSTYILLTTTFCTHFIRFDFNFWFPILTFFSLLFQPFFSLYIFFESKNGFKIEELDSCATNMRFERRFIFIFWCFNYQTEY